MNTICNVAASAICHQSFKKHKYALPGGFLTVWCGFDQSNEIFQHGNPPTIKNILSKKTAASFFEKVMKTTMRTDINWGRPVKSPLHQQTWISVPKANICLSRKDWQQPGSFDSKLSFPSKLMESQSSPAGRKTDPYLELPGGSWP